MEFPGRHPFLNNKVYVKWICLCRYRKGTEGMKSKTIKLITLFMVTGLLITSTVGCGGQKQSVVESNENQNIEQTMEESSIEETDTEGSDAQEATSENSESQTEDGESQAESQNEEIVADTSNENNGESTEQIEEETEMIDRSRTFELLSKMNVGWNLGNTLDAHGAGNSLNSETYWGNPKTTKEMVDAIKAQGINTIRIPVTWAEHVGSAPDYTINEEWLDRVQEVVDYAVANDMYIIIDTHHEPDFWLTPKEDKMDDVKAQLGAIWKQVAERFKDYDEKLLFEGMNEPRNKGTAQEWNGGTTAEQALIDELNAVFVDAVRSTGGNNEERVLIICAYGNTANSGALKHLVIPKDPNIAVAVHLYTPYVFTYEASSGNIDTWSGNKTSEIEIAAKMVDKFLIQNGVPAIVTEFGAVNKGNSEEVIKWLGDYMGAMNEYGIKCIWWDNNIYDKNGEKFGIFDRQNLSWYDQAIADALVQNAITE